MPWNLEAVIHHDLRVGIVRDAPVWQGNADALNQAEIRLGRIELLDVWIEFVALHNVKGGDSEVHVLGLLVLGHRIEFLRELATDVKKLNRHSGYFWGSRGDHGYDFAKIDFHPDGVSLGRNIGLFIQGDDSSVNFRTKLPREVEESKSSFDACALGEARIGRWAWLRWSEFSGVVG